MISLFSFIVAEAGARSPEVFWLNSDTLKDIGLHLLNVGVLAFVLSKILYNPVRNFMSARSQRIAGQLELAAAETAKAGELKALYEQKMQSIEAERDIILGEARKQSAEASRQLIAEAKSEADSIRAKAQSNVKMEWERASSEMRGAIIDVSAAMSAKFIKKAMDAETADKLFAETMAELGDVSWRN